MRVVAASLAVVSFCLATSAVLAQDTCDVAVTIVDPAPGIVALGLDYSGAGGGFPGDSNHPGQGPSWGTTPLHCTVVGTFDEVELYDDNAGALATFFADLDLTIAAGPLFSCVFALDAGFPCPDPSAFTVTNAAFPSDPMPPPFPLPPAPAVTIAVTPRTPVCGDGFQEGAEQCDDGNLFADDCCTDGCVAVPSGSACDDHDVCTSGGTCDAAAVCVPAAPVTCDDGVACTWDHCDPEVGCVADATPSPQCHGWRSGSIDLRDHTDPAKRALKLQLKASSDEAGDPTQTTDYAVCVFDESAGTAILKHMLVIPAGAPWSGSGASGNYKYVDPTRAAGGVEQVRVLMKAPGRPGKFQLKAKSANLALPAPFDTTRFFANDPKVVVQVENTAGSCWAATIFTNGVKKNDPSRYQAKH